MRGGRGGPGGLGMDPRQMARMMKQMGISVEEIDDVEEVLIRCRTREIVIRPAAVSLMVAQGQKTWQVTGEGAERPRGSEAPSEPAFDPADVKLVAEQAGVSEAEAREALVASDGEPAAAIVKLLERK